MGKRELKTQDQKAWVLVLGKKMADWYVPRSKSQGSVSGLCNKHFCKHSSFLFLVITALIIASSISIYLLFFNEPYDIFELIPVYTFDLIQVKLKRAPETHQEDSAGLVGGVVGCTGYFSALHLPTFPASSQLVFPSVKKQPGISGESVSGRVGWCRVSGRVCGRTTTTHVEISSCCRLEEAVLVEG